MNKSPSSPQEDPKEMEKVVYLNRRQGGRRASEGTEAGAVSPLRKTKVFAVNLKKERAEREREKQKEKKRSALGESGSTAADKKRSL